ncbi:hypothetical protein [Larsenimonas salina]|uniref:hypothetical protein n=1 Tax=Larsenimonas salina TaxID=1295565 RepID=UPI002073E0EC|nr:hypothetical protein [Larsenimonas salina]MCM5704981.1 hypothetical protein [Larsenimonas salina]
MINVDHREGFSLRISRILGDEPSHEFDFYLFLPGELGFSAEVVSESEFYHGALHIKRTYYSTRHELPLIHSRLARRTQLSPERYRSGLSLYAFQYAVALEQRSRALEGKETMTSSELDELTELCQSILRRLRRQKPAEERLGKYFINIDNYLSWLTEQTMLSLAASIEEQEDARSGRMALINVAKQENQYRREHQYNSERAMASPSRMSNKMRLLRRLIEYPVTLKEKRVELGRLEQKGVKALAAGMVMVVVSMLMFEARTLLGDLTLRFVLVVALMYAAREVFKDDLRNTLWRWLRRGRPKWRRQYFDNFSGDMVGRSLEWFDYARYQTLPEAIRRARKGNVTKRDEHVLHYKSRSSHTPKRFLSGYERTREVITLDLQSIARLMDPGRYQVFDVEDGAIQRFDVEKRYQVNLVIRTMEGEQMVIRRWKVTLNHTRIVDLEAVEAVKPA